jgi:cellulose 1,4-beta-cellobiosidase
MKTFTRSILAALAGVLGIAVPSAASAQVVHVDNPFVGATMYRDPDYAAKVQTSIDQVTDASLRTKMQAVKQTPTAVWLDRIAAIAGGATAAGLEEHLDNALAQRQGNTPIVALFVIYDLPGRDCSALASNGELPLSAAGFARYRTEYIDVIAEIMGRPEYQGIRIATVIEPDGLPNLVTNLSDPECAEANRTGLYVQAVQYALNKLHAIPNVYTYLDIAHSGWLGWPNNASGAVSVYTQMVNGTTARFASVDGFVTNTANTLPLREPFLNASQNIGGQQLISGRFFEFNPNIDEISFTADLYSRFTAAGWPASIGFLIDTSRNGWGGAARPTGPGTSTDLNTFINQSKIDRRQHRGLWCNQAGSGLGAPPQAAPAGFPASHLDAFVWVKPPGDSDGSSRLIPNNEGKGFDRFCDPTFMTPLGTLSNALPDAPISGAFFHSQFVQLVQNAFPVPGGGPSCAVAPPAPTTFTATPFSSTQVNLAWSAVTAPANCSVTFNLYRSTTANFQPSPDTQIATGLTTTSFSDTGRAASTTFFYIVESVDEIGRAIARASATTPGGGGGGCAVAPAAVTNLAAAASSSSQIIVTWNAVAAPPNCAVTYTVHRSTTANFTPSASTLVASGLTATSHVSTGLAAATTFHVVVLAVDAAGTSAVARTSATTGPVVGGGGGCRVVYTVVNPWNTGFQVALSIQNTGITPINGWTLTWTFPGSQQITSLWNGAATQAGAGVTVNSLSHNATIAPGASYNDAGFTADGPVGTPASFAINGTPCN